MRHAREEAERAAARAAKHAEELSAEVKAKEEDAASVKVPLPLLVLQHQTRGTELLLLPLGAEPAAGKRH